MNLSTNKTMAGIWLVVTCLFMGCHWPYPTIDLQETKKPVYLNQDDLKHFEEMRIELAKDFRVIQRVMRDSPSQQVVGTNSYYLNKIDSVKYSRLLQVLKGKVKDEFLIWQSGCAQFIVKDAVQLKDDDYNDHYWHLLVNCAAGPDNIVNLGDIQKIYFDSVIDTKWRYVYLKTHTGW